MSRVNLIFLLIVSYFGCFSFAMSDEITEAPPDRGPFIDIVINSNAPDARIINANDGQVIGTTPFSRQYRKAIYPFRGSTVSLIIEREGFLPLSKIVVIDKWGRTRKEATEKQNEFYFLLDRRPECRS